MSSTPNPPAARRLILHMSTSLDGFVARRPSEIDWLVPEGEPFAACGAARHAANLELIGRVGGIVLGRNAYDEMGPFWSASESPMARLINALPKLVFTSSRPDFEWSNAGFTPRPVEQEIPALKAEPGDDLVCFGGGRFAHSLIRHGLVDDYYLTVHPVALGDGLPPLAGPPRPPPPHRRQHHYLRRRQRRLPDDRRSVAAGERVIGVRQEGRVAGRQALAGDVVQLQPDPLGAAERARTVGPAYRAINSRACSYARL